MAPSITTEAIMTLDDIYGSENERFPLEQEALNWDEEDLGLVWDEDELQRLTSQYDRGSRYHLH
jgi:hypothetical protein